MDFESALLDLDTYHLYGTSVSTIGSNVMLPLSLTVSPEKDRAICVVFDTYLFTRLEVIRSVYVSERLLRP